MGQMKRLSEEIEWMDEFPIGSTGWDAGVQYGYTVVGHDRLVIPPRIIVSYGAMGPRTYPHTQTQACRYLQPHMDSYDSLGQEEIKTDCTCSTVQLMRAGCPKLSGGHCIDC